MEPGTAGFVFALDISCFSNSAHPIVTGSLKQLSVSVLLHKAHGSTANYHRPTFFVRLAQ